MIRVGLIGLGPWGANILRALVRMPDVELAWTAGRNWERKAQQAADAVIIASPARTHGEIATWCLSRSVPVFIEKPLATTLAEALDVATIAGTTPAPVLVDHTQLFQPAYERLQAYLSEEKIFSIESLGGGPGPYRYDCAPLWDYGPHDAAFVVDLLGSDVWILSAETSKDGCAERVRFVATNGEVEAQVTVGNDFTVKSRALHVRTDKAQYALYGNELWRGTTLVEVPPTDPPLTRALRTFLDAVVHGTKDPRLGIVAPLQGIQLLDAVEKKLKE